MAIKYYQAQDAIQKFGINVAIRRTILSKLAEDAIDAEYSESPRLSTEDDQPSKTET